MQSRIEGTVVDSSGNSPTSVSGLAVIIYELDTGNSIGSAQTAADGGFVLVLDIVGADMRCAFTVTRDDRVLLDTQATQTWSPQWQGAVTLVLLPSTVSAFGTVRAANGDVVESCLVQLLTSTVNDTVPIGSSTTDAQGRYSFAEVPFDEFVLVRALDGESNEALATSVARKGAGRFDLVLLGGARKGAPELESMRTALAPLLQQGDLTELTAAQLTFLAASTGLEGTILSILCRAARVASAGSLALDFVYALARTGHAMTLLELLAQRRRFETSLVEAIDRNIVAPRSFAADLAAADALVTGRVAASPAFASAAAASVLTTGDIDRVSTALLANNGPLEMIWANLRNDLGAEKVDAAQDALRLDVIANGHAPFIESLLGSRGNGWSAVRELAAVSQTEWEARIATLQSLPDGLAGSSDAEKISGYATSVRTTLAAGHPTASLAADLLRVGPSHQLLSDFVKATPAYEMDTTPVRRLARERPELFSNFDAESVIAAAEPVERLFRITPPSVRSAAVPAMAAAGYHSALSIVRAGRATFIEQLGPTIGDATAAAIFSRATHTHASATAVLTAYSKRFAVDISLIEPARVPSSEAPDWADLFGSLDYCRCEECQSVLSPAAYMVDLLHFLQKAPAHAASKAYQVLINRRADLPLLPLSCANTNTHLPHIDLVNELLELRVAPPTASLSTLTTTWPAEELAAHPEHVREAAYSVLSAPAEIYPISLPYDLYLDETRSYVGLLGTSRAAIRSAVLAEPLADIHLALERLGLTPADAALLGSTVVTTEALWGIASGAAEALSAVPTLLSRAELSYEDLLATLASDFVAGPEPRPIVRFGTGCDVSSAAIVLTPTSGEPTGLTDTMARRIALFERLRRRTSFSAWDLDRAIVSLGGLTESFLVRLSHAKLLVDEINLPLSVVLSFWGDLDTRLDSAGSSQFEGIFVPKARAASHPFKLNTVRTELATTSALLTTVVSETAAGLGVSAADVAKLVTTELPASATANLSSLSRLYAYGSLARALGIDIPTLIRWRRVMSVELFDPTATASLLRFVDNVRAERRAKLTAEDAEYVLTKEDTALTPSQDVMSEAIASLRADLVAMADTHAGGPDPDGAITLRYLRMALPVDSSTTDDVAGDVFAIINRSTTLSDGAASALLDATFSVFMPSTSDRANAIANLVGSTALITDTAGRFGFVLPYLLQWRNAIDSRLAIVESIGRMAGVSSDVSSVILNEIVHEVGPTTRLSIDTFMNLRGLGVAPFTDPVTDDVGINTLRRVRKVAYLAEKFRLNGVELRYVNHLASLDALPVLSTDADVPYRFWSTLRELRHARTRTQGKLFDLLQLAVNGSGSLTECLAELAKRTGWSRDDLTSLAAPSALNLAYPADFADGTAVLRLFPVMDLVARTQVNALLVWDWQRWPTATDAAAVKDAVRARLARDAYFGAVVPVRDAIRERQREALVAHLRFVGATGHLLQDREALAADLLIDLATAPCFTTSRVKQALSSIQLFVQRAQLKLEPDVDFSSDDLAPWKWMRNYRVWEANRKVFLWPENWIEPELRDDKTPFFKELESKLHQTELDEIGIEGAYRAYLMSLNEVASLEVSATCRQTKADGGEDVLYVFARTRGTPRTNYWRTRVNDVWGPWQKLDVDIEGGHLVAVFHDGLLHLFWPIIEQKQVPPPPGETGSNQAYFQVTLAWTAYVGGSWTTKRVSVGSVPMARYGALILRSEMVPALGEADTHWRDLDPASLLTLQSRKRGNDLFITIIRRATDRDLGMEWLEWQHGFRFDACHGLLLPDVSPAYWMATLGAPAHTDTFFQDFISVEAHAALLLPYLPPKATAPTIETALAWTPTPFRVVANLDVDHAPAWPSEPFFLQDERRGFFVSLHDEPLARPKRWAIADGVGLDGRLSGRDWFDSSAVTAPAPVGRTIQPPLVTSSFTAPEPVNRVGAPERVFESISNAYHAGIPAVAAQPIVVRTDIAYHTEAGEEISRYGSGGDGERSISVSRTAVMPSPTVTSPIAVSVALVEPHVDRYLFEPFYHPYVCTLLRQLQRHGLGGVLDPLPTGEEPRLRRQSLSDTTFFSAQYFPTDIVAYPYPSEIFDFGGRGAYSAYNWELFFHVPIYIALRLVDDQRFEDALRWFHTVFNPTERAVPSESWPRRVWKFRPFFETGVPDSINGLVALLTYSGDDPARLAEKHAVERQIDDWSANPFEPHRIARIRPGTYQRFVVKRYIEALVGWGDQLFRRETLESISEATEYYIIAQQALGDRPVQVTRTAPSAQSFADIAAGLDAFSEALVKVESLLPGSALAPDADTPTEMSAGSPSLAFCVPPNERLLGLWDLVEDRLFKIRHCMNIDGEVLHLPLFEAPIDPALLVRATAAGLDLASVLDDLSAPPPQRRFRVLLQKALEVCGDVRSLGSMVLSALERRDAEDLARLRASHETEILALTREVKRQQVQEAQQALAGLERSREAAEVRFVHYSTIAQLLPEEDDQQKNAELAAADQAKSHEAGAIASAMALIPQSHIQGLASGFSFGGQQLYNFYQAVSNYISAKSAQAQLDSIRAGHQAMLARRSEEWKLQADVAAKDMQQIDKQILAQQIRLAVAEQEVAVSARQVEQAGEIESSLRAKYTNQELYDWMVSQLSAVYFQSYKLAFDLARRAERAFQFERSDPKRSFIHFGIWESLRKGLLSGERLALDLRRMEVAFLAEDRRELELARHVSLSELDPLALVRLRETGVCTVTIPEWYFDMDGPGHYLRRIRTISLSIPSVTGPYVPVRCTLTLLSSSVRTRPSTEGSALQRSDVAIQSIVTSQARDDSGLFDGDTRDERYLPFEGAGAVATFRVELASVLRTFDYETIPDIVLHMRYTARDGGDQFRSNVIAATKESIAATTTPAPLALMLSVKNELPDAWQRLFHPPAGNTDPLLVNIPLDRERFPFGFDSPRWGVRLLKLDLIAIVAAVDSEHVYPGGSAELAVSVTPFGGTTTIVTLSPDVALQGQPHAELALPSIPTGTLALSVPQTGPNGLSGLTAPIVIGDPKRLDESYIRDLLIVVHYTLDNPGT